MIESDNTSRNHYVCIFMTDRSIKLFQETTTHNCSYLAGQQSRNLFVDPTTPMDSDLLDSLNLNGFRRSGKMLYRPHCPSCNACKAARVLSKRFRPRKSQKRIIKRNFDIQLSVANPADTAEYYALYERYINLRHYDGEMYPPTERQFADFLCSDFGNTRFLLAHKNGQLIACMVFDVLSDALSAVYCFYDPELEERSLGSFMILSLIRLSQSLEMPYNYLGYWVKDCQKMDYKKKYRPLEVFSENHWQRLD